MTLTLASPRSIASHLRIVVDREREADHFALFGAASRQPDGRNGGAARMLRMTAALPGLVIWDVDGTLIPADLRWPRRAIARTYAIRESDVVFPAARVHGFTDESIVVEAAVQSGIPPELAENGVARFDSELAKVMSEGAEELARDQPAYPGAAESIAGLDEHGFVQTVLTGNLRHAAETKLRVAGLDSHLNFHIGAYGSAHSPDEILDNLNPNSVVSAVRSLVGADH